MKIIMEIDAEFTNSILVLEELLSDLSAVINETEDKAQATGERLKHLQQDYNALKKILKSIKASPTAPSYYEQTN